MLIFCKGVRKICVKKKSTFSGTPMPFWEIANASASAATMWGAGWSWMGIKINMELGFKIYGSWVKYIWELGNNVELELYTSWTNF